MVRTVSSVAGKLIHGAGEGVIVEGVIAVAVMVGLGVRGEVGTKIVVLASKGLCSGGIADTQALRSKTNIIRLLMVFIFLSSHRLLFLSHL